MTRAADSRCAKERTGAAVKEAGRILFLANRLEFFLSHRMPIARAAAERGYQVHVATPAGDGVATFDRIGWTWHELRLKGDSLNPVRELFTLAHTIALLERVEPTMVHTVALKCILHGGIASRICRIPAVVHTFTGLGHLFADSSLKTRMARAVLFRVFRFALSHPNSHSIFQNPDDRALFMEHGAVSGDRSSVILGSGVPIDTFTPAPEPSTAPVVLLASRLIWDKGIGEFVKAAEQLREEGTDARFVIAGESDPLNPNAVPEEKIRSWESRGIIEWWGFREDMPEVFSNVHVVCLPSYYREGVPKVLIEAASSGRPVVTTDSPGCREIVREGVNGRLVPPRDTKALKQAIAELIHDKELRDRMGGAGRQIVKRRFSLASVVEQTMDVYDSLAVRLPKLQE